MLVPSAFVAVSPQTKTPATEAAPLISPVVVLMLKPAGRFGQAQLVGVFVA